MSEWKDLNKIKPDVGQDVLIYRQGYGNHNNYYFDYHVASYVRNPYDKRRYCFVPKVEKEKYSPWIYTKVSHWMTLPIPPNKIELDEKSKDSCASMVQEILGNRHGDK